MIAKQSGIKRPRFVVIAEELEDQIRSGGFVPGDRAPSLRRLKRREGVSLTTVQAAYHLLEDRGYLEARPRSGYFVRYPVSETVPQPRSIRGVTKPARVTTTGLLESVIASFTGVPLTQLGAATPSPDHLPTARLSALLGRTARIHPELSASYEFPPGNLRLRRAVARRAATYGCSVRPEDVLTTVGTMEALNLSLRAVARGGDAVAIESPTYFGILQMIESLSMRAFEIPTHPGLGMDLDFLEGALRRRRVKACIVMANCHNPLGYVMTDERKRHLADLAARYRVPVIEDDIFGDLAYTPDRPNTVKSFDRSGWVILCSSVSKTLAPGLRIGWVFSDRFSGPILKLKFVNTVATPSLQQMAVAELLDSGGYDRHLHRLRRTLRAQVEGVADAIHRRFPAGTRTTRPAGGYVLWIEMPRRVRSLLVYREAIRRGIALIPGEVFSVRGRFRNYMRVSCGHPVSPALLGAIAEIGQIAHRQSSGRLTS